MYAYEYGVKNFKHKTNFKNLVVFSDTQQNTIKEVESPSKNIYLEIEKGVKTPNKWFLHFNSRLPGEYGDFFIENNPPYGEADSIESLEDKESFDFVRDFVFDLTSGKIPYYKINEKFYIRLDSNIELEEVFLDIKVKAGKLPKPKEEVSIEYDSFVTLLISNNGAKLETAYQRITDVNAHEVVVFIETNKGTNAFGTVFRLKKGKNVKTLLEVDRITISKVARAFGVEIGSNELTDMIQEELENDDSQFYFVTKKALSYGGKVIRWSSDEIFTAVSKGIKAVSSGIDQLKLDDTYWRTEIDGKENLKFNPLLPKLKNNEKGINTEAFIKSIYNTYIFPLTERATEVTQQILSNKILARLIPFNLEKVIQVLNKVPELLQEFFEVVVDNLVDLYYFINGVLVGLINSIIDFIKSFFDILAMLFDVLNGIIQGTKFFENPGSYLSLFAENFENLIDSFVNIFTLTNLKQFFSFLANLPKLAYTAVVNILNTPISINIDPGAVGYYLGFFIGFVASEVATFFATGGTGNIAKALKAVLKSYKEIVTIPKKIAENTAKVAKTTVKFGTDAFARLWDIIIEFSKNIPEHLKTLENLISDFVRSLGKAGLQVFEGLEAVFNLLVDLGVIIVRGPNSNLETVPVYNVNYRGKTILQGPEDAINKFAQRIDEIVKSGGNTKKKVKHYLDDLAGDLNIKHKEFLDSNGLRIEKPKKARSNLQIVDEAGDIHFYGKSKEIDEYVRLVSRTDAEKIADYKKVINYFNKSNSKYKQEKIWSDGSVLKFSEHNKPRLCVDFKSTPQFIYGNKNDIPGVVKIKLTGNDNIDFKMAFKKAGISDELSKTLKEDYVWHHMDDFDPITGECTMQLVKRNVHEASCPHIGGGGLYKAFMGIGYPNRKIKFK